MRSRPAFSKHHPAKGSVRLIPREVKFFSMFAEMSANLIEGARLLRAILADFENVEVRVQQLKEIEHRGDEITHAILTKVNQTFITPFDREDIHRLASTMDDVLDFLNAAGERLVMYKITSAPRRRCPYGTGDPKEQIARQSAAGKHDHVLDYCVRSSAWRTRPTGWREAIAPCSKREGPHRPHQAEGTYEVLETAATSEDVANVLSVAQEPEASMPALHPGIRAGDPGQGCSS
jgi:hypothetical protein